MNYQDTVQVETAESQKNKKEVFAIYCFFLASSIPYLKILALVGITYAYLIRNEVPSWLKTHIIFQIRTFWIGIGLFLPLLVILPFSALDNVFIIFPAFITIMMAAYLWPLIRIIKGLIFLIKNKMINNPKSWWLG